MVDVAIPDDFDLSAAVQAGVKEAFSDVARLKALKEKPFLTPAEVEELYGYSCRALKAWRRDDKGPRFYQLEKRGPVRYAHEDIRDFMTNARPEGGREME